MRDSQLVHVVQGFPGLGVHIKQMNFTVSICVLSTNQQDFCVGNGQSGTGPERILHSDGQHDPLVLLDLVLFNCIVDLLLSGPEEATEGIDMLVA